MQTTTEQLTSEKAITSSTIESLNQELEKLKLSSSEFSAEYEMSRNKLRKQLTSAQSQVERLENCLEKSEQDNSLLREELERIKEEFQGIGNSLSNHEGF